MLHAAWTKRRFPQLSDMLRSVLFRCCSPAGVNVDQGQLLHYAIWREDRGRLAVVQYLLDMGDSAKAMMDHNKPAIFEQRRRFGLGTPLHDAAAVGDVSIVRLLIERGADLTARDTRGMLAYQRAQLNGHEPAVELCRPLPPTTAPSDSNSTTCIL